MNTFKREKQIQFFRKLKLIYININVDFEKTNTDLFL